MKVRSIVISVLGITALAAGLYYRYQRKQEGKNPTKLPNHATQSQDNSRLLLGVGWHEAKGLRDTKVHFDERPLLAALVEWQAAVKLNDDGRIQELRISTPKFTDSEVSRLKVASKLEGL